MRRGAVPTALCEALVGATRGARQARDFRLASGYVGFDAAARRFGDARWNGEQCGEAMRTRLNGETT
jgi:hypothetical protein